MTIYKAGSNEDPVAGEDGEYQLIDNTDKVVEAEILSLDANVHYYAVIMYKTMSKTISANIPFSKISMFLLLSMCSSR